MTLDFDREKTEIEHYKDFWNEDWQSLEMSY